jgi:hypothetical protein
MNFLGIIDEVVDNVKICSMYEYITRYKKKYIGR